MSLLLRSTRWLFGPAIIGSIVFLAAGRVDLPMVWAVFGVLAAFSCAIVFGTDPSLMRERIKPGPGNRDKWTRGLSAILLLTHWILTGLDVGRFQWSLVPFSVQVACLIGHIVGMAGVFWAMRTNPFYSCAVRIQAERGHRTIAEGPYRFVRHPGYTASLVAMTCGAIALGSWIGVLPLIGVAVLFIRRTLLEDRMLQRELSGYAAYAQNVRYRLLAKVF